MTFNQCRDIVFLSILIGSRRTRADMPRYSAIKSQFVYENLLYSPLPHADSFPLGATPRNEITLFNSLFAYITHMGVFEGNPRFLSEHVNRVWDSCTLLISLDWKGFSYIARGRIYISSYSAWIRTMYSLISILCSTKLLSLISAYEGIILFYKADVWHVHKLIVLDPKIERLITCVVKLKCKIKSTRALPHLQLHQKLKGRETRNSHFTPQKIIYQRRISASHMQGVDDIGARDMTPLCSKISGKNRRIYHG